MAGVIPTTNPTSTAIFKSLIALKTRNGIIFSPHPRAKKCTVETARLILEEAVKAGAPENIIGWIDEPTILRTQELMQHPKIDCILATGGPGMVKSAYSSGKPALGVGAGNTPAVIDETADIKMAVSSILMSKTFDNGMICASEQSIVCVKDIYDEVKKELEYRGAYLLSAKEKEKGRVWKDGGKMPGACPCIRKRIQRGIHGNQLYRKTDAGRRRDDGGSREQQCHNACDDRGRQQFGCL